MLCVCPVVRSRPNGPSAFWVARREAVGGAHSACKPKASRREWPFHLPVDHVLEETNINAICPECEASLTLENVLPGEIIVCPDCGVDLEVTAVAPAVALALAPQEAEDWGE